jgi:crotonobetainyl-CoA:carnitine CoA-transferase CaiB-like acyl-CoA transferase
MATEKVTGPLAGIRVLDMTSVLLGPIATQIMGDMGADIIKVESPEGDVTRHITPFRSKGMGAIFLNCNRNKRSVVLDLKQENAKEAFLELIRTADVLATSVRPHAMRRLGLHYDTLRGINRNLIYCGAYGFGESGPYAGKPAYDDIIQAASGVAALQGVNGGGPRYANTVMADKVVGLTVLSAISMALFHRERHGGGQHVEIPMFETMAAFMLAEHLQGATFEPRDGPTGYARVLAPHRRPQKTADGHVALLPYTTAHWTRFFNAMGRPELMEQKWISDPVERSRNIGKIYALVAEMTPSKTTSEWLTLLNELDIPAMPVNGPDELLNDTHLSEIDFFPLVDHPSEGRVRIVGQPINYANTPAQVTRLPAPLLGEHSRLILSEAGLSSAQIAAMAATGATRLID